MRMSPDKALLLLVALLCTWSTARAETCAQTLKLIQELYNNTANACPSGEPASNCSGLMIRGTKRADPAKGEKFDVWTYPPASVQKGASSYSLMRTDINFQDLAVNTNNGFIATPTDYLCAGQKPSYVQCALPMDGWTWERGDRGCGDNSATVARENYCQDQGINDGRAWVANFQSKQPPGGAWSADQYRGQCAFDLAQGRGQAGRSRAFAGFMEARRLVGPREFAMPTELLVSNKDEPNILAWIYTEPGGRADALKNQADYLAKTGNYRPVIRVQMPRFPGEKAQFFCDEQQPGFAGYSRSPGFCKPGVASTPGFGTTTGAQPVNQAQAAAAVAAAAQAQVEAGYCKQYIASTRWVQRTDVGFTGPIWSLEVTPTECGRRIGPEQTDRMYAELYNKHKSDPRWNEGINAGTLRRQLVCHFFAAREKNTWNLEPGRPYVSHEGSLRLTSPCNPTPADAGK